MGLLLLGNRGSRCLVSSPSLPGTPAPLCSRLPQQPPLRHPRELNLPTTRPVRGLIILSELCMELYLLQETRLMTRISRLASGSRVFHGRFLPRLRLPDYSLLSPGSAGVLPAVPSGSCPEGTQPLARPGLGGFPRHLPGLSYLLRAAFPASTQVPRA